jgi:hypothetical protein
MTMEREEALTTDERSRTEERLGSDEGLSTRDLASPHDRTTNAGASAPDAPEPESSGQTGAATASSTSTTSATVHPAVADTSPAGTGGSGEGNTATDLGSSGDTSTAADPGAQAAAQVDAAHQDDALRGGTARQEADAMQQDGEEVQAQAPVAGAPPADTRSSADTSGSEAPLVPPDMGVTFQQRWEVIQTRFVDEPRGAVEDADGLVANLMQQLAAGFAKERERLERQWDRGEDISTEDLRVALQRYRSFFQRLLST